MGPIGSRREAFSNYTFIVEIDGERSAYFRSASGLKSEAEVVSVEEGGVSEYEHKLIGRTKYPNLVLKQGFSNGKLWRKRQTYTTSDKSSISRFSGTIIQLGPGGKEVYKWQFEQAWISKWEGPEFDASKNEISVQGIEIAHEGLKLVGGGGGGGKGGAPTTSIKTSLSNAAKGASRAKAAAAAGASAATSAKAAAKAAAKSAAKAEVTAKVGGAAVEVDVSIGKQTQSKSSSSSSSSSSRSSSSSSSSASKADSGARTTVTSHIDAYGDEELEIGGPTKGKGK